MAIDEAKIVPEINFPTIPKDASREMREYLVALEILLRESLKGSLYVNKMFEDGYFGN